ncbi:hypothetical protein ACO2Q0_20890 [Phenylobacterium sp. VNQ135]|uniref:hypothetical protein n=1 Tax=Phenylobacterium sp. VNQ135 TaxID=3400922 RepID=UPI003C04EB32
MIPRSAAPTAGRSSSAISGSGRLAGVIVLAVLPLFAQSFQYTIELPLLYALSKGWPLVTLPLTLIGLARVTFPGRALALVTFVWIYGVTPWMSQIVLNNTLPGAVASTVKVWAFAYLFSLPALLAWLRPSPDDLRRMVLVLGAATFLLLVGLWVTLPASAYQANTIEAKILLWDPERGPRINLPMFFGLLLLFTLNRHIWLRRRLWPAALLILGFLLLMMIYKARMSIAAAGGAVLIGAALSLGRWRWAAVLSLVLAGALAAPSLLVYLGSAEFAARLGGSLTARQAEAKAAVDFLNAEPWRWVTGVGNLTRVGDIGMAEILQTTYFFVVDLGWLGVIFEFGLVGALLIAGLCLATLRLCAMLQSSEHAMDRALLDYVVYILLTSWIYPVVYAPGELAVCAALAMYFVTVRSATQAAPLAGPAIMPQPARRGDRPPDLRGAASAKH